MAGVTLPTTDEHLSTFHAFSSEDALERLREAMQCIDSGAPIDSASAAAAEREVQDQIAEYVTEPQPSAHDPRILVQSRQLAGHLEHTGVKDKLFPRLLKAIDDRWISATEHKTHCRKFDMSLYM